MSSGGQNVELADRKFQIGNKGKWSLTVLDKYASKITNVKGNEMPLMDVQIGHKADAVILGETIQVTRII